MKMIQLARRGFRFYWKSHVAAGLAILVAAAVLTGAMSVGDSIKASLLRQAQWRLGKTRLAVAHSGLFRADLAGDLAGALHVSVAPVLLGQGFADSPDGAARVGDIQVLGVDERFWNLGPGQGINPLKDMEQQVAISEPLARRLHLAVGQDILVRLSTTGGMPIEAVLAPEQQRLTAFRWTVGRIVDGDAFGRFDLYSRPDGGMNIFIPLARLHALLHPDTSTVQVNLLLMDAAVQSSTVLQGIKSLWQLPDAGLELREPNGLTGFELRSDGVFFADSMAQSIARQIPAHQQVLTYFVNELRAGDNTAPYSFVGAIEDPADTGLFTTLAADEMIINENLADDLGVSEGGKIEIRYFVPSQGKSLSEQSAAFTVKTVVPMMGTGADTSLMPSFEAMADAENCRDWKPGIPIDFSRIRPEDEQYWQQYKGAPKAFIAMKTARQLWSSRFGTITAMRFPAAGNDSKALAKRIVSAVEPSDAGFAILDTGSVRTAAAGTTDFSGLVTGLSFFLIAAALILAGLVYSFALQRRLSQLGILSAAGLPQGQLFTVFILEHSLVVVPAVLLGIPAGMIFTKLILAGLNSIWASAAGGLQILFSVRYQTLLLTGLLSVVLALIIFGWKLRGLLRRPAVELLNGGQTTVLSRGSARRLQIAAVVLMLAAGGLAWYGTRTSSQQAAMMFFTAGACLLAGLAILLYWRLSSISRSSHNPALSLLRLAINNASRRKGRSLAVVTALAMGVFVVVSVGGFQKTAIEDPTRKDSGSGGFTLWAKSSIPIGKRPDAAYLHEEALPSVPAEAIQMVSLRQYSEGQASCLNLARTQQPIVWGVIPEQLAGRFRFKAMEGVPSANPFDLLNQDLGSDVVPAIGDYATVYWSLHKRLGDQVDYLDQDGRLFHLHIVGLLDNSSLQGGLLISEKQFLRRFRSQAGWNVLLVQTPAEHMEAVAQGLTRAYESYGLEAIPTAQRLALFHEVENTYIAIFMALGSLGLLLGSVGLGLVVLLNVLDRAGELAMMRAMGFEKARIVRMILIEHAGLLAAGLVCGVICALVAAGPQLSQAGKFPWPMLAGLVAAMAISGLLWVACAVKAALRGELLEPLRKE